MKRALSAVMQRPAPKVPEVEWEFDFDFHAAQRRVYESTARFKVLAAGRRFGKSLLGLAILLVKAAEHPDSHLMWVAKSHRQARSAFRACQKLIPRQHREVNRTFQTITLPNGAMIEFVSGTEYDNLRGDGLIYVVIDEAAFLDREVWTKVIRPALADTGGGALIISTFNGENWFYDLYLAAIDPDNDSWDGWRFKTSENPHIPAEELVEARRNNPHDVYMQEYEASPLAFSGSVFGGEVVDGAWQAHKSYQLPLHPNCEAGLDWGYQVTAFEICCELTDGKIAWVGEKRWSKVELVKRCHEICDLIVQFRIQMIYADAAGADECQTLGSIIAERGLNCFVQPVPFNAFKTTGIKVRQLFLEKGRELIYPACKAMLLDTKAYHFDPNKLDQDIVVKKNDHSVDACTAFYASRGHLLQTFADVDRQTEEAA